MTVGGVEAALHIGPSHSMWNSHSSQGSGHTNQFSSRSLFPSVFNKSPSIRSGRSGRSSRSNPSPTLVDRSGSITPVPSHLTSAPSPMAPPLPIVRNNTASDQDDEAECPVCLEPLSFSFRLPGEKPHISPECGHALHEVRIFDFFICTHPGNSYFACRLASPLYMALRRVNHALPCHEKAI